MDWVRAYVNLIIDGVIYDLTRYGAGSFITALAGYAVMRWGFGKLKSRQQSVAFLGGEIVFLLVLFYFIGRAPEQPKLKAGINYMVVFANDLLVPKVPPIAICTITIVNGGNAQSVVLGLSLQTTIDGQTYIGIPVTLPEKFPLAISGRTITYYGKDSLLTKLSVPIVAGGEANGVAAFAFSNATAALLNRPAKYVLRFNDAFGHEYQTERDLSPKVELPNSDLPGVTQEISPEAVPQSPPAPATK